MNTRKSTEKNLFVSKLGAILAVAGSAVGLGNVWRFPTEAGTNGGAAFILIYILFMLFFAMPVMIVEFAIGRHGGHGVVHAFEKMSGGKRAWRWMGLFPIVSGFLILSYYSVVGGWTLYYAYEAIVGGFADKTSVQFAEGFSAFSSDAVQPVLWTALAIALTCGIVVLGVQKGIERGAKTMMPLLFLFMLVLVGCSLTLPGAKRGLAFLFNPDFSRVDGAVILSAMGQAFFSLSVGLGCLCTYACYFRKDLNLMKEGLSVAGIDTLVALLSGLIIFPAVYSIPGLRPDEGPSLVFITLPNVFQQTFGTIPLLSAVVPILFYLLLVMAALTSSISMLEMTAAGLHTNLRMSRTVSTLLVSLVCIALGACCAWSFGPWKNATLFGMTLFELFDFLVAKIIMPVGGILMCVFVAWVVDEKVLRDEMTNHSTIPCRLYAVFRFIIRYIAPVCILLLLINGL